MDHRFSSGNRRVADRAWCICSSQGFLLELEKNISVYRWASPYMTIFILSSIDCQSGFMMSWIYLHLDYWHPYEKVRSLIITLATLSMPCSESVILATLWDRQVQSFHIDRNARWTGLEWSFWPLYELDRPGLRCSAINSEMIIILVCIQVVHLARYDVCLQICRGGWILAWPVPACVARIVSQAGWCPIGAGTKVSCHRCLMNDPHWSAMGLVSSGSKHFSPARPKVCVHILVVASVPSDSAGGRIV